MIAVFLSPLPIKLFLMLHHFLADVKHMSSNAAIIYRNSFMLSFSPPLSYPEIPC